MAATPAPENRPGAAAGGDHKILARALYSGAVLLPGKKVARSEVAEREKAMREQDAPLVYIVGDGAAVAVAVYGGHDAVGVVLHGVADRDGGRACAGDLARERGEDEFGGRVHGRV